jgi:hypothetical protein
MDMQILFELISKFIWPVAIAYAAYIHRELVAMDQKFEKIHDEHHKHVAQVNKDFATREVVSELETKLTVVLNRIDDKVTRILQERK